MQFVSTRGGTPPLSFTAAVEMGLAPDGGLLIPERLPNIAPFLTDWARLPYPSLCTAFFSLFATDMDPAVLAGRIERAYQNFSHPLIAPLRRLEDGLHVLELFHGPTLAFKDFALQLLGELYDEQIARTGRPLNILGATSGDTGAAAIRGLLGKRGIKLFILYPDGCVSPLQERQMACTGSPDVYPLAVTASFDDAQKVIKAVFGDLEFRRTYHLSAVNSINLARILAQSVYYLYALFQLPPEDRENVEFIVPTGNFGNVLAGWLLTRMGVDGLRFRVATNQNDILYRLFQTGRYELDAVRPSHAPSMDIQVASNFERFLYFHEGRDPARVIQVIQTFATTGRYAFPSFDRDVFSASRATDADIESLIREVWERYQYVVDPHTACGFAEGGNGSRTRVVLGTAHPAKFPTVIQRAIGREVTHPALEELKRRPIVKYVIQPAVEDTKRFISDRA